VKQVELIHKGGVKKRTLIFDKVCKVFKNLSISSQGTNCFSQNLFIAFVAFASSCNWANFAQ
jgi:hypothetical protein